MDKADNLDPAEAKVNIVSRASAFSKTFADEAFPIFLGKDIEFSFIQIDPQVKSFAEEADHKKVDLEKVTIEVGRVRIPTAIALELALHLIQTGIKRKILDRNSILEIFEGALNEVKE